MTDYFVRSLSVDPLTYTPSSRVTGIALRLIYEFWGYCINGTALLTTPGGMPTTPTAGPANGFEGTTVLATGSDGQTILGAETFDSAGASFSSASHLGKHIVTWKPSDPTSQSSIYKIIGVPSATQLVLQVANGGTPDPTTLKPSFTSRAAIRYRIIDLATVGGLVWVATTHYVVLQFTPTLINAGQASSQVQFQVGTAVTRINMILSPGGTWTGAAFTDGSAAITPVTNGSGMFNSATGSYDLFTMIADENSLIMHISGFGMTAATTAGMYVEIPKRLYTLGQDPNPITCCAWGVSTMNVISATADLGGYWWMKCPDTVTRNHRALTRAVLGIGSDGSANEGAAFNNNMLGDVGYNYPRGLAVTSPVLLGHHTTAGQFTLARVRLRRMRMATIALPDYKRIGTNGEWLHLTSSVMFPWDNTILPFNLMALGF